MRITTPAPGYTGTGPGGIEFRDGAADVDLSKMDEDAVRAFRAGPLAYYRDHGYGIDGEAPAEAPADPVLAADPREVETVASAPLRDAAVDPRPGDFLVPTNAGAPGELGNPHGPHVVSPGIHGSAGPVPPLPGPVSDDPAEQEAKETGAAHAVLVDGAPVGDVMAAVAEQADADASDQLGATDDEAEPAAIEAPAHSARKAEWVTHAQRLGADPEEAEQLTKPELIDQYDRPAPNPAHKAG